MAKQKNANVKTSTLNNPKENQKEINTAKIKILAIVLSFVALFLLVALLSYNKQDQANAEISLFEMFGLFTGDELIILKAETTQNLLGLLGAYISNYFFNHTTGYSSLIFPIILIMWSVSLFREYEINRETLRKTYLFIILSITFSSLMGAIIELKISDVFTNEWAGVVGLYLSNLSIKFISMTGTLMVLTFVFLIELYYTFGLKIDKMFENILNQSTNLVEISKEKINQIKENAREEESLLTEFDKNTNDNQVASNTTNSIVTNNSTNELNISAFENNIENNIEDNQENDTADNLNETEIINTQNNNNQNNQKNLTIKAGNEVNSQNKFITQSVSGNGVQLGIANPKANKSPLAFIPGVGKKMNMKFNYPATNSPDINGNGANYNSPNQVQNQPVQDYGNNYESENELDLRELIQQNREVESIDSVNRNLANNDVEVVNLQSKIEKDNSQAFSNTNQQVVSQPINSQPVFNETATNQHNYNEQSYEIDGNSANISDSKNDSKSDNFDLTKELEELGKDFDNNIHIKDNNIIDDKVVNKVEDDVNNIGSAVESQVIENNQNNNKNDKNIDPLELLYAKLKTPSGSELNSASTNRIAENTNGNVSIENLPMKETVLTKASNQNIESKPTININYNKPNEFSEPKPAKYVLSTEIHDEEIQFIQPKINYLLPDFEQNVIDEEELRINGEILQEKLLTFKITIEDLQITPGPVVTLYEFVPSDGIKISKIQSLENDLAMALKAKGIRIIAPVPGKGTVGIEIPNNNRQTIRFSAMVESNEFKTTKAHLPIALGKDVSGNVIIADLAKMPHLLIAGTTGSGKSVGINTIILSLLYKKHPSELKFIIVDPKKVELQQYAALSQHFIASSPDVRDIIITNPADAVMILKSAVIEMEQRYTLLASVGQRNLFDYNEKVENGQLKGKDGIIYKKLPFIVVIIDELADLMLTASKEIEEPIVRLAQMARAVGIHMILATQRPSVKVITGLIKANFPARIAYTVKSNMDSRVILDVSGAEQLLGYGDMLFMSTDLKQPTRVQNSFLTTDEVETVCQSIEEQVGYSKPYMLPSTYMSNDSDASNFDFGSKDELFEDAARFFIQQKTASTSILQRRFRIGYARAGKLVDELEAAGIIGPANGSKPRLVLYESEADLERIL